MFESEEFVYLLVTEFSPYWLESFYRFCVKKAVKGTRVDELFVGWQYWYEKKYPATADSFDPYFDLAYIGHGKLRDALAIPREAFSEIISELGLKIDCFYNCDRTIDAGRAFARIVNKYILSQTEKQSFFVHMFDFNSLWSFRISEDFSPTVFCYSIIFSANELETFCSLPKVRKSGWHGEHAQTNEKILNAVKDVAFGKRKTRIGFLDRIRDRIKSGAGVDTAQAVGGIAANTGPEGGELLEKYQQTAQALIIKTVKPLLKYIKDTKKYKDEWPKYFEKSESNISQIKKQGVRIDGNNWFFEKDGVRYGYCSQGCWAQNGAGTTHYILIESKFKEFYEELSDIAEKLKNLS